MGYTNSIDKLQKLWRFKQVMNSYLMQIQWYEYDVTGISVGNNETEASINFIRAVIESINILEQSKKTYKEYMYGNDLPLYIEPDEDENMPADKQAVKYYNEHVLNGDVACTAVKIPFNNNNEDILISISYGNYEKNEHLQVFYSDNMKGLIK